MLGRSDSIFAGAAFCCQPNRQVLTSPIDIIKSWYPSVRAGFSRSDPAFAGMGFQPLTHPPSFNLPVDFISREGGMMPTTFRTSVHAIVKNHPFEVNDVQGKIFIPPPQQPLGKIVPNKHPIFSLSWLSYLRFFFVLLPGGST
jgi:hypothetical protein